MFVCPNRKEFKCDDKKLLLVLQIFKKIGKRDRPSSMLRVKNKMSSLEHLMQYVIYFSA
jgi:hypothetical protein